MDGAVGVRFTEAGPITYCAPADLRVDLGDYVVVRTPRGERLGWVVLVPEQVLVADLEGPLRVIDRLATEADVAAWRRERARAEEDTGRAQAVAARSDARVRVASLTYDLSGQRLDITCTAPERVDTAHLARAWAAEFDADVEVERVGDRDRAKAAGGLGVCGLALCCATWMTEFPAISMKMAKEQDLPPNPSKISGVCGRLLCCLTFEVDAYRELRGGLPRVGKQVTTPAGPAKVLAIHTLTQRVRLRMQDSGEVVEIAADELRAQYGTAVRPADLEAEVEAAVHARDRELRERFLAVLEPVGGPRGGRPAAAARGAAAAADPFGPPPLPTGDDGDDDRAADGRRGRRRGGRRRTGGGGGGAVGAGGTGGTAGTAGGSSRSGGRRGGGGDRAAAARTPATGAPTNRDTGRGTNRGTGRGTNSDAGSGGADRGERGDAAGDGRSDGGEVARARRRGRRGGRGRRRGGDAGSGGASGGDGGA